MAVNDPSTAELRAELELLRRRVAELEAAQRRAQVSGRSTNQTPAALPSTASDPPSPTGESTDSSLAADVQGYAVCAPPIPELSERARRASAERYALIATGTGAGVYDLHFRRRRGYLSPRWKEIVGYSGDDAFAGEAMLQERLHPDDRARYSAARGDHLDRRLPFSIEVRLRDPGGGYRWVHVIAQAQWDRQGQPVRLVGSLYDVTGRKQLEEALHSQQRAQGQLEGVTLAARELAHRLNNELAVAIGALELVQRVEHLPASLRVLLDDANAELAAAAEHITQLQRVVRIETKDTPVGPALDLERSLAPNPPAQG